RPVAGRTDLTGAPVLHRFKGPLAYFLDFSWFSARRYSGGLGAIVVDKGVVQAFSRKIALLFCHPLLQPTVRHDAKRCHDCASSADKPTTHTQNAVPTNIGGLIGRQEDAGTRHLFGSPLTAQRNAPDALWGALWGIAEFGIPLGVTPLCIRRPGHDHIGPNAIGS